MERIPLFVQSRPESAYTPFVQQLPDGIWESSASHKGISTTEFDARAKTANVSRIQGEETTVLVSTDTPQGFVSAIIRDRTEHRHPGEHVPIQYIELLEHFQKTQKELVLLFTHTKGREPDQPPTDPSLQIALRIAANISRIYKDIAVYTYIPPHPNHQARFSKRIITAIPDENGIRAVFFEHEKIVLPGPLNRWVQRMDLPKSA